MKKYTLKETLLLIVELIFLALVIVAVTIILSSCCRPATDFQRQKWEQTHKFEAAPYKTFGLHIFRKKNVYKY